MISILEDNLDLKFPKFYEHFLYNFFMITCPNCGVQLYSEGFLNRHVKSCPKKERFISDLSPSKIILIVEDDLTTQVMFKDILELDGHNVITCSDGAEAIHLYIENSPDLVLMDLNMPTMNGCKAIWQIKEYDPDASITIITGYFDENDDCQKMEEKYQIPFYKKPVKAKQLLEIAK